MNLNDISSPQALKNMTNLELKDLAKQIRTFLIQSLAKTGGHLSSNLGVVELTLAIHKCFDSPTDKIIFDVGHQSYVHKILTGRLHEFNTLRQFNGLSGFQKRCESIHDPWEAGHSSTSLSAALGMAIAADLQDKDNHVIAVIGDGAMGGGMALEALNQIGTSQKNLIIIFNDNNMSISKNVGAMDEAFTKLRASKPYSTLKKDLKGSFLSQSSFGKTLLDGMSRVKNVVKNNVVDTSIFGDFNIDYIGPFDGHDLGMLEKVLTLSKQHSGPIVVHVITNKGKGYPFAQNDYEGKWHGVPPFDPLTGNFISKVADDYKSWSEVIANSLCEQAKTNKNIVAITPAMIGGSKLEKFFKLYPKRSFDCGIAEEHAMTFAAGLCASGMRPFISVYSSFLQRAYDQIQHDVARMKLPVVIGIDRCSLVGEDGETHHGVFDISMLRAIPNMVIAQPKNAEEACNLLYTAFEQDDYSFAIRYPRGNVLDTNTLLYEKIEIGSWTITNDNDQPKAFIITYGDYCDLYNQKCLANNLNISIINARFIKPLDDKMLIKIADEHKPIFVVEHDMLAGGLSSSILEYYNDQKRQVNLTRFGIGDIFVTHGSVNDLKHSLSIDIDSVMDKIIKDL